MYKTFRIKCIYQFRRPGVQLKHIFYFLLATDNWLHTYDKAFYEIKMSFKFLTQCVPKHCMQSQSAIDLLKHDL